MKSPLVTFQPHPPHRLQQDLIRVNMISNVRLPKTTRQSTEIKISRKYKFCVWVDPMPGLLMVFEAITTFTLHTEQAAQLAGL